MFETYENLELPRPKVKRLEMALHIQEICAKHKIKVEYQSLEDDDPRYMANRRAKKIIIRPTKNTGYYVSALHEIGHVIGSNQNSGNEKSKEIWAWIFALDNALVWTETAERIMNQAMDSYDWGDAEKELWQNCKRNRIERNDRPVESAMPIIETIMA